jgi:methylmalonyl-CoA mutase
MSEDERLRLREDFPAVSTTTWEEAIRKDLKGADISKLVWKTDEGIAVRPFYRAEDLASLGGLDAASGEFPYLRGTRADNRWSIRQTIDVADPQQANAAAREALAAGAESIGFEVVPEGSSVRGVAVDNADKMRQMIAGLAPEIPISFRAEGAARALLLLYLAERKHAGEARGSIDYDPLGDLLLSGSGRAATELFAEAADLVRFSAAKAPRLRVLGVRSWQIPEAGGNVVQELAFALARGVEYLSELTEAGLSVDEVASKIFFIFSTSTNYFFEIAKLRAFRVLWARAVEPFAPKQAESAKAVVESVTARWGMTLYDAHINLLRGATGAMSAAIGGADAIEITPFDTPFKPTDDFSRRLARNSQVILKNEAYLDRVADPAAGSYYIEVLTDSLGREAWRLFQQVEAEGGFLKAITSGFVQRQVAQTRQRKDEAVAARKRVLLGTNQYPNQNEQALDKLDQAGNVTELGRSGTKPAATAAAMAEQFANNGLTLGDCLAASSTKPAFTVEKLLPYRAAESFEALRLRSERHTAKTGHRPRVLLIEYGDLKMRKARVAFSLNFFAVAGFEIVSAFCESTPDAAAKLVAAQAPDLVVLCSADGEYAAMAGPLIRALPRPIPVIVAGSPQEIMEQLKRDGVADFIHIRSNALEVLSRWQRQLGVE